MRKLKIQIRVAELDTVSDSIIRAYKQELAVAKDSYLKGVMAEIEDLSEKITTAIKAERMNSMLDEANKKRNEEISATVRLVRGYASIPLEDKKEAAKKLMEILDKYKGITKESYGEESSHIESMLQDLAAPQLADYINLLEGVSIQIMKIRETQDEFILQNDKYVKGTSIKKDNASLLKKPLLNAINKKLLPYLETMSNVNQNTYNSIIDHIQREIDRANTVVTKRKNTGEQEETSEVTQKPDLSNLNDKVKPEIDF